MHTPKPNINFREIALEISEWIERNYGYFVNKNSDKNKIIDDFAEQLERLPVGAMSYIQQAKNNFIDSDTNRPPLPVDFIQHLKIIYNQNKKTLSQKPVFFDKNRTIFENILKINDDFGKIKYIKTLSKKGFLRLKNNSVVKMEIEQVLKRNNFSENEIVNLIEN